MPIRIVSGPEANRNYYLHNIDETTTPSTTYFGLLDINENYLFKKMVDGSPISISYASRLNNPSIETYSDGWASRVSLNYDLIINT